jgi:hypothetical protein
MRYYLLRNDLNYPNRWFLGPIRLPASLDVWTLTGLGPILPPGPIHVDVSAGRVLDFTFADFSIPILNSKAASFLPASEVQLLGVDVGGLANFFLLLVVNEVDCVDESASDFLKFDEQHPIRPDLAGKYELFYKLVVNKTQCAAHSIFKIKGCHHYIIVNEAIRDSMHDANIKGVYFEEV